MQLFYFDLHNLAELNGQHLGKIDSVFKMWREVYTPILAASGESLHPDTFFRSRYVVCISEIDAKTEVAHTLGFCLLNTIDLKVAHNLGRSYFEPVPAQRMTELLDGREKILTVEWVTVRPESRVRFQKIQLADLIMGAAFRFLQQSDHTLAMGYSRTDVGADRIAASFGVRPFDELQLHGIPCRLMIGRREWVGRHRFSVVEAAVENLWQSAVNFTSTKFNTEKSQEIDFENKRRVS